MSLEQFGDFLSDPVCLDIGLDEKQSATLYAAGLHWQARQGDPAARIEAARMIFDELGLEPVPAARCDSPGCLCNRPEGQDD